MTEMTEMQERKILKEAQERLALAIAEDKENRDEARADLEFIAVPGSQWPSDIKSRREAAGRPCLEINKVPIFIDQVVGDQRMNRPAIKVIPVDSVADIKVAKILGGWIKHVQQISSSDVAIDHGFEHAVACGYGALRVITKYVSDTSFEQDAFIEKVDNALAVFWGPHSKYDCSDAGYCFIVSDMDREEYKSKYKAEPMSFNSADAEFVEGWATKDKVRVAEYFVKEYEKEKIYLTSDGRTIREVTEGDTVINERVVDTCKVMWYLLSGNKVLDSRLWVGKKYIPVIPIWGKEFNVAGKRYVRGLVRFAKDSQRMYNYWVSTNTEMIALQPRAPYLVTPKQMDGHEAQWREAQSQNYPYLLVNFDEKAPGWPKREAPPVASSAMIQAIQLADQELRDTMGLQKAALGMQSNERSGAAIRERKKEGDTGTFAFVDNLSRSTEHLGRVLIDVAPGLLDTERIVRLGFEDETQGFEKVNVKGEGNTIINDVTTGTYDVVVTVGPSFTTQRTEARESMQQFIQYYPAAAPVIGDIYAKNMDWPGAEDVAERLEVLLPPEIRAAKAAKEAKKAGVELPPPSSAPAQPPNPVELLKVEEEKIKLEEAKVKLQQEIAKLEQLKVQTELMVGQSKESLKKLIDEIVVEEVERQGVGGEPPTA